MYCLSVLFLLISFSTLTSVSKIVGWFCLPFFNTEVKGTKVRKKLMAPDISLNLDHSEKSILSDESEEIDLDDIDTPSENSNEFEWEGKCFVPFVWHPNIYLLMCRSTVLSSGK